MSKTERAELNKLRKEKLKQVCKAVAKDGIPPSALAFLLNKRVPERTVYHIFKEVNN